MTGDSAALISALQIRQLMGRRKEILLGAVIAVHKNIKPFQMSKLPQGRPEWKHLITLSF